MGMVLIFIQIVAFPVTFLLLSRGFTHWALRRREGLIKLGYATQFAIAVYIIGGVFLFPLYFAFQPIKIEGITYLTGANLWAYWLITYIVVLPLVGAGIAYFLYFRKVVVRKYYKEGLLLGLYQIPWALLFEIVIYVYWRKTIPSVYDYFLGKNYPWIEIAWMVSILSPLIAAEIARKKAAKSDKQKTDDRNS